MVFSDRLRLKAEKKMFSIELEQIYSRLDSIATGPERYQHHNRPEYPTESAAYSFQTIC
jgi:hypothetical protein